jgi:glutathione-specific gamma-glutamylcyclotransferase
METMDQFWVFGYGSLMWRPGFAFAVREPALVHGFRRSLCVLSHVHRGTPERPGLVLGLDSGGSCRGVGYRVAAADWEGTLAYLREREQVTMVYREVETRLRLLRSRRTVRALAYVVDRSHPQYAGCLDVGHLVRLVRQGHGGSGPCLDYVVNTVNHLRELGIHDAQLEAVMAGLSNQASDKAN